MRNPYFLETKQIVDTLSADQGLILEEKLILLELMASYIAKVTKELEGEQGPRSCDKRH